MEKLLFYTGKDLQDLTMDTWLQGKSAVLRPIATKWFGSIEASGPDVQSIFHDGCPVACLRNAPFAYVNAFTAHVNIGFFYGAELEDKYGLLQGSGKRMRHIKVLPGVSYDEEPIHELINAAYIDIRRRLDLISQQ